MKARDLREQSVNDLKKLLLEQSKERFKIRMEQGMGETTKSSATKNSRRTIARIQTIISEKERQA